MNNSTGVLSGRIRASSVAVFAGIIIDMVSVVFTPLFMTNSERRKLSVEANTTEFSRRERYIPASVGRILPSAVEKSVRSIAFLRSPEPIRNGCSALKTGISGNFDASIPLILVSEEGVVNWSDPPERSSTLIRSSDTREINDVRNFAETVKLPSVSISTHFSTMYSIAISRLFAVRTIFLYWTLMRIFSRMGVIFDPILAWVTVSIPSLKIFVSIVKRIEWVER